MAVLAKASFAVTVMFTEVPAVAEPGPVTTKWVAGPGTKVTLVEAARADPLSVPVIVVVPATVDFTVAV